VQYAELMDFCYVWLRRLVGGDPAFRQISTRNGSELTGNVTMERGLDHFTEGLPAVMQRIAEALKPGAPLIFTFHHNDPSAYYPVAVAVLDSGLTCSASLPCPAEMGASIHIKGTGSSVIDTVFVCRSTGSVPRKWIAETPQAVAGIVLEDVEKLREGGLKPTLGDIRCIISGHLIRLVTWRLRKTWDKGILVGEKIKVVAEVLGAFGSLDAVETHMADALAGVPRYHGLSCREERAAYFEEAADEIPF
jgi:hypothetical protein